MAQQLTHIELLYLSFIGPDEFVNAFARELSSPLPSKGYLFAVGPKVCKLLEVQLFFSAAMQSTCFGFWTLNLQERPDTETFNLSENLGENSLYAPKRRDFACDW